MNPFAQLSKGLQAKLKKAGIQNLDQLRDFDKSALTKEDLIELVNKVYRPYWGE